MPVTLNSVLQVAIFLAIVLLLTKPLGLYMYKIFNGERTWLSPVFVPVERFFYRLSGVNPEEEQKWTGYMISVLIFSVVGMLLLYAFERTQQWQGSFFNPQGLPNVEPQLAFNTAASFTTNTNWQNYTGEQTMSYLTQMAGLAFHQFVSAAAGIALAVALVRGLARRSAQHLGNFWVDLVRCTLYLLLPICIVGALVFVSQGMIQNFNAYTVVHTLNGGTQTHRPGAGGLDGDHQGPGHQRRRLLQRQRRSSLREPQRLHCPTDHPLRDLAWRGPVLHVRQVGGRYAPGLGAVDRLRHPVRDRPGGRHPRRADRQSHPDQRRREPGRVRDAGGRQHGGQGGALRHHHLGHPGSDHDGHLDGHRHELPR